MLEVVAVTFGYACDFVEKYHRQYGTPVGWKFGAGAADDGRLCGVAGGMVAGLRVMAMRQR